MTDTPFDVVQIGYGPVSEVLAAMLGRQGRRVAVFERWTQRYPLPRAVCIDHEMHRMLGAIGMGEQLPRVSHPAPPYRWFNAEWQELLSIDWSAESISGGPAVHFVHQPTLEEMFDQAARAHPTVRVELGWEATAITQTAENAEITLRHVGTGAPRTVRARYVVGTDGANSTVRRAIGSDQEDRGFEADWLVIDVLPNPGVTLDIPDAAQWCNPARPTTIVPGGVRDGVRFRRWEFMRLPHEAVAELETEAAAWALLAPWVRPDQATIVRHKVYTFRSLLAEHWRGGRLLLAGDSAHVMPPFMGQGMCSGLRDAWNLAWKLGLVLDGRADPALLDSYQTERRPHVGTIIDMSMYLGQVICQPDPDRAAERDRGFVDGTHPPPPPFPHLVDGILQRAADGLPTPAAGLLSPHSRIRLRGREGWLDDLVGTGFTLILRGPAPPPTRHGAALLARLNIRVVALSSDGSSDLDGRYDAFLREHGLVAMLVRPDFYLFGGAAELSEVDRLLQDLADQVFTGAFAAAE